MIRSLLNRIRNKNNSPPSEAPVAPDEELIRVYDTYGREMQISRGEWRKNILLPGLQKNWHQPDELYDLIVSALTDGFFNEVDKAAEQLVAIDPLSERSHTIRGIVLMKMGRLDAAEKVLRTGIKSVGKTATLLTNLAKVYAGRGDHPESERLLWQAIQLDPNMENGLLWWAAINKERDGEAGYRRALEKAAAIAGSWRPQLGIAREYLQADDLTAAIKLYEKLLSAESVTGDLLMIISGDLGNSGHENIIPALIGPVYKPHFHGPRAGLNLLQAYLKTGLRDEGVALLHQLYELNISPFKKHLDDFAHAFDQLVVHTPVQVPEPNNLQVETVSLDRPVWALGLRDPEWLFKAKPEDAPGVTFLSFARRCSSEVQAEAQQEDDIGRLTRAIPLYLAEAVHYWTSFRTRTLIPAVVGGGPIVFGSEPDVAALCEQLGGDSRYFVTGVIEEIGDGFRITCFLYETATARCTFEQTLEAATENFGSVMHALEKQLLETIGKSCHQPWDSFYQRPAAEAMTPYLTALGQSLTLSMVANKLVPREAIWGERNMIEWPLRMALQWPDMHTLKLMYFSGLGKAFDYGSDVLSEFRARSLQLLKDARQKGSPAARLAPLVWSLFDMQDELEGYHQSPDADNQALYQKWLERIVEPPRVEK